MLDFVYMVLCLATWAACFIAMVIWTHKQMLTGKELPIRIWWLKAIVGSSTVRKLLEKLER